MSQEFIKLYNSSITKIEENQLIIVRKIDSMLNDFVTYYSESELCKNRFTFNESDFNFLITKSTEHDIKTFQLHIKSISKKPEWKNINQPENIILLFLLRYFYSKKNVIVAKKLMLLMTQRFFSGLLHKYFKHGCQKMVMDFAVNNLSKYFLLGKHDGNINQTLVHVSSTTYNTYEKRTILEKTDDKFLYLIIVLRTSINSFLKNTASVYYKAFDEKLYLSANQKVSDKDDDAIDISEFANNSSHFAKVKNSMTTYINRIGRDTVTINKVSRLTQVKPQLVEELFIEILRDEKSNSLILDSIFKSFNSFNINLCDKYFILKTVQFLNSKYDSNKVKETADFVLNNRIPTYKKSASSTKSRYKKALILLYTIYLQKANCGN